MTLPTDFTGLTGWWDATQDSFADNDAVGTWTDRGSFTTNFTQGTAGNKPTFKTNIFGSLPAIYFTTNDYLVGSTTLDTTTASSVFAAIKPVSFPTSNANIYDNGGVFCEAGGYMGMFLTAASGNGVGFYNFDGTVDTFKIALSTATPYVVHMRHDATTLYGSINGGTETTTASGTRSSAGGVPRFGTNYNNAAFIDCYIGEIAIYNTVLSTGDVASMNTYLQDKWIATTTSAAAGNAAAAGAAL